MIFHFQQFFHLPYYNSNRTMDLPYPSQRDDQLTSRLSPQDRRRSAVLKDSLRLLPSSPPLPKQLRMQLATFLNEDMAYELRETVQKEVVSLRAEAGKEGSYETLLHVACRYDAVRCLNYLLHTCYQYFPEDYESWVNAPNRQGVTAAMLCVLSHAESSLETLLRAGGVDIHIIDSNKLSAYQLALNCKNQPAVRMLMDYENASKKTKLINHELLSQAFELQPTNLGWCQSIYRCLLNCLSFGDQELPNKARRKAASVLSGGLEGLFMEQVELGYTVEQLGGQVEWKLMGEYQERGKIGVLFDTFSPFDMEDILHPSGHLLIVLQSLSQHPWLIRRLIQPDRVRSGHFCVTLQDGTTNRCISVDSYLPFARGGSQPLFLADKKQGWPMLLQKALAKHFGSYSQLSSLPAQKLMQVLTGWPAVRKQVVGGRQTVQLLQQLNSHGFMYVLLGRVNSLLSSPTCPQSCFTVLTFFSRGDKRLVLVNCPFVDPDWVEKEKNQMLALKIMRGHYNCREQMTIWVEEERLRQYFSDILVCPIKSGQQKQTATVSCKEVLHFRITIEAGNQEEVIGYLLDETGGLVNLGTIEGWKYQKDKVNIIGEVCRQGMLHFDGKQGEYMFRVTPPPGKYQLIFWSECELRIESLQQTFGALQWIACLRHASAYNWKNAQKYLIQTVRDLTLLMVMGSGNYYASVGGEVLEGKRSQSGAVELISDGNYGYCVLKGKIEAEPTFYQA